MGVDEIGRVSVVAYTIRGFYGGKKKGEAFVSFGCGT